MRIDPEGHEIAALARRLPPAARVVEIGCGDGRVTRRYNARVKWVTAIDPDANAIALFRAGGLPHNVDASAMPVERFMPAARTADVVLFSWSL